MTQSKALRVAIIGCGRVAGHHGRSIAATQGAELGAVCDLDFEKAEAMGREFDVPAFANYHEMFRAVPNIDLVAIITPSGMHHEHATEIMTRYRAHLIVEKPTFMRPDQLADAYDRAHAQGREIFPVFQNRSNKAVLRVKRALGAGELGDIRIVAVRTRWCRPQRYYELAPWRGTFSHDGGALANQGIHHVDLLRHLGGEVARVNATMRTLGANIEVEDTVVATFTYRTGAVGNLEVTTAARPDDFEASLSIVGSKGLAEIGGIAVNELRIFTPDPQACAAHSEDFSRSVYGFGHEALYRDIVAHFRERAGESPRALNDAPLSGRTPYPVARADALASLQLLHAFYRSDEAGGWVEVESREQSTRLGRDNEAISKLYRTPAP